MAQWSPTSLAAFVAEKVVVMSTVSSKKRALLFVLVLSFCLAAKAHPPAEVEPDLPPGTQVDEFLLPGAPDGLEGVMGLNVLHVEHPTVSAVVSSGSVFFVLPRTSGAPLWSGRVEGSVRGVHVMDGELDLLLLHLIEQKDDGGEIRHLHRLSRLDMSTGEVLWTSAAGLAPGLPYQSARKGDVLTLWGAVHRNSGSEIDRIHGRLNRIVKVNVKTGEVLHKETFDLRRELTDGLDLLVQFGNRRLVVIDQSAEAVLDSTWQEGDLLVPTAAPMYYRSQDEPASPYIYELDARLGPQTLTVSSRELDWDPDWGNGGMKSAWVQFDWPSGTRRSVPDGHELKSGLDQAIRRPGGVKQDGFPVVVPGFVSGFTGKEAYHWRTDKLVVLEEDGSVRTLPLPDGSEPDGERLRLRAPPLSSLTARWFQSEGYVYSLDDGRLHRVSLEDGAVKTLVPWGGAPPGRLTYCFAGGAGHVVLAGDGTSGIVRLADGKLIAPAQLPTEIGFLAMSLEEARNYDEYGLPLSEERLGTDDLGKPDLENVQRLGHLRVVPHIAKRGRALLVGLPTGSDQRLFVVPVVRLSEPFNNYYAYDVDSVEDQVVLTTPLEQGRILVYRFPR